MRWSAPVRIAAGDGSSLAAGSGVYSVTAAGGAIAWIDERHRRSDRRWWNPLGGWPWSDAPAWANNDVFLMQLPAVAAALSGGEARFERLTPDLSYAGQVRLGASRSHRYVLWSGRRRVGKHRTDRGAPPEIFLLRRPLP